MGVSRCQPWAVDLSTSVSERNTDWSGRMIDEYSGAYKRAEILIFAWKMYNNNVQIEVLSTGQNNSGVFVGWSSGGVISF